MTTPLCLRFWMSKTDRLRMEKLFAEQEQIIRTQKERIDGLVNIMISKNELISYLELANHELRMAIRQTAPPLEPLETT